MGRLSGHVEHHGGAALRALPCTAALVFVFHRGSGGSGPAVMASTFFAWYAPASEFVRGEWVGRQAFTGGVATEFLAPVGRRTCYSLELPETTSCYEIYKILIYPPALRRRRACGITRRAGPVHCLSRGFHRQRVASLSHCCCPLIRVVDRFVGAAIAMDVAVESADGQIQRLRYVHESTMESIAQAVTAQNRGTAVGSCFCRVHFPEEAIRDKERHLQRATVGGVLLPVPDGAAYLGQTGRFADSFSVSSGCRQAVCETIEIGSRPPRSDSIRYRTRWSYFPWK